VVVEVVDVEEVLDEVVDVDLVGGNFINII
jgi:hypothetical protein